MNFIKTDIEDLIVIEPQIFGDDRGYFFESYSKAKFNEAGITNDFVQDNQSMSAYGIIRGLHFQKGEYAQAKLVRVIKGKVIDSVVDLRPNSKTFGKTFSIELSQENQKQLFVPRGFAHGFSVLEDNTIFTYKCDNLYNKESEGGLLYNDPALNIDWKIPTDKVLVSDKDKIHPTFEEYKKEM